MPLRLKRWPARWQDGLPASDDPALPEDPTWCFLIPQLHLALANPAAPVVFPRLRHDGSDEPVSAFWETALYLMHTLLGWSDPGRGLQWWYQRHQEDLGDERLRLLKVVWARDEDFDLFAAWCWEHGATYHGRGSFRELVGSLASLDRLASTGRRSAATFLDGAWWERARPRFEPGSVPPRSCPYTDDFNPLHLGHSMAYRDARDPRAVLLRSGRGTRHAVLLLDQARGWYRQLLLYGRDLPMSGVESWHVEVIVRPLGWLGVFRKSAATGLWFQGKHSVHDKGQPTP